MLSAGGAISDSRRARLRSTPSSRALPRCRARPRDAAVDAALVAEKSTRIAALSTALASRVAWDRVLRQISQVLPEDVWLTSLVSTAPAAPTPSPSCRGASASSHRLDLLADGVARLLARLAVAPTLTNVQLQSSTALRVRLVRRIVQFTIIADVKPPGAPREAEALATRALRPRRRRLLVYALLGSGSCSSRRSAPRRRALKTEVAAAELAVTQRARPRPRRARRHAADRGRRHLPPVEAMPTVPDMPGILLELARIAEETGIQFQSITPQPSAVVGAYQIGADRRRLRRQLLRALGLSLPAAHARRRAPRRAARRPAGCSPSRRSTSPSRRTASPRSRRP